MGKWRALQWKSNYCNADEGWQSIHRYSLLYLTTVQLYYLHSLYVTNTTYTEGWEGFKVFHTSASVIPDFHYWKQNSTLRNINMFFYNPFTHNLWCCFSTCERTKIETWTLSNTAAFRSSDLHQVKKYSTVGFFGFLSVLTRCICLKILSGVQ